MFLTWLRSLVDPRDGDQASTSGEHTRGQFAPLAVRVVLMSVQILGIVTAFTLTKAVRDAVFLSHFRMQDLALVSLVLTVLSSIAVAAHQRWIAQRYSRGGAAVVSLLVVAASLVGFQAAIRIQAQWAAWALYLWSGVFGLFLVAQFWIMALDVFDPREARRAFPLTAAGASVGGVIGGLLANWLSHAMSEASMLLIVALVLTICALLAGAAWRFRPPDAHAEAPVHRAATPPENAGWRTLLANPLLRTAAIILVCSSIAGTLLDWQVKAIAKSVFHSQRGAMTEFFGRVLAISSIAALVLQIGTTWILRRFGVARGLLALPAVILAGAALFTVQPALGISLISVAVIARTGEMGVRYAIDKPALELLYMPVEGPLRASAKSWLDTVADRVGGAVTALVWLALQFAFDIEEPSRVRLASIVIAAIALGWMIVALRARAHHLDAFRVALSRGEADLPTRTTRVLDRGGLEVVQQAVATGSAAEVQVALEVLAGPENRRVAIDVAPLLQHPRGSIRARAVEVMRLRRTRPTSTQVAALLADPSVSVRVAVLEWVLAVGASRLIVEGTNPPPPAVRELLVWAAEPVEKRREIVREMAISHDADRRALTAVMAASLAETDVLRALCDDDDSVVVAAALGAMRPPRSDEEITLLLALGVRTGTRAQAVERLARAPLARLVIAWSRNPHQAARGLLCDAIAHSTESGATEVLSELSGSVDAPTRRRAWRDLAMRRTEGGAPPSLVRREALFAAQIERLAMRGWVRLAIDPHRADQIHDLVARALDESIEQETAALFDVLALFASPREVREANLWLREASPRTRATCLEFLDNALPAAIREKVMPWLEPTEPDARCKALADFHEDEGPHDLRRALETLAGCDEGWLRALAVDALSHQGLRASRLPHRDGDPDPRVERVFAEIRGEAVSWPI